MLVQALPRHIQNNWLSNYSDRRPVLDCRCVGASLVSPPALWAAVAVTGPGGSFSSPATVGGATPQDPDPGCCSHRTLERQDVAAFTHGGFYNYCHSLFRCNPGERKHEELVVVAALALTFYCHQ